MADVGRLSFVSRETRRRVARGVAALVALLGSGLVLGSGCVLDTGGLLGGGGASASSSSGATTTGTGATCTDDCDDEKPCTKDSCVDGACVHENDSTVQVDDGNECTADACSGGKEQHTAVAGKACGKGLALSCNAQGQCVGCADASSCPAASECKSWICDADMICQPMNAAAGTKTPDVVVDCKQPQCDGAGAITLVADLNDIADDGKECTVEGCDAAGPTFANLPAGTACSMAGGEVCSGKGTCVECVVTADCAQNVLVPNCDPATNTCVSCNDGAQNGAETGVDCGGLECVADCGDGLGCNVGGDCQSKVCQAGICQPASCGDGVQNGGEAGSDCGGPCAFGCPVGNFCVAAGDCDSKVCTSSACAQATCFDTVQNAMEVGVDCGGSCAKCNGQACGAAGECVNGICADGVCCNAACGGVCTSCNLPGALGVCKNVPIGMNDASGCSAATDVCGWAPGSCVPVAGKKKVGEACVSSGVCFNSTCGIGGICRLQAGEACGEDIECLNDRCLNGVCTVCTLNGHCASKACLFGSGTCKVVNGQACSDSAECEGGKCQSKLCKLDNGDVCDAALDCKSGVCAGGSCAPCANGGDCDSGLCNSGVCLLPPGAACAPGGIACGAGACTGFPMKCQ